MKRCSNLSVIACSESENQIVPDFTVKSAVTSVIRRFPSDLLETSVDPEENFVRDQSNDDCAVTPVPDTDDLAAVSQKDFQFTPSTLGGGSTPVDQALPSPPPPAESATLAADLPKPEEMVRVYQAPPGTSGHNPNAAASAEVVNGNDVNTPHTYAPTLRHTSCISCSMGPRRIRRAGDSVGACPLSEGAAAKATLTRNHGVPRER